MTDRRRATLDARVKATNLVHDWANKVGPILRERFRPLIGQKLLKVDGSFLEKYKALGNIELPDSMHRIGRGQGSSWLSYRLDVCVHVEGTEGCLYANATVHIGNFSGQILESVRNAPLASETLRTNYTSAGVLEKRAHYERLQKLADEARSELFPFGEYDLM